jgi:hypothetical protein
MQVRVEAHPLAELEELALLYGPSDGLLLRQVQGWYSSTGSATSSTSSSFGSGGTLYGTCCGG